MKSTVLTGLLFLFIGTVTNAQLSFLPQIGFEQSRTTINYGDALSTAGMQGNFRAALKADYRLKGGHSPFINISTSPAPTNFIFADGSSVANAYKAAKGQLQWRLEGGYQFSSNPIQFKKKSAALNSNEFNTGAANTEAKRSCGSSAYRSRCGQKGARQKSSTENNFLNMRLQPSLAVAYMPSAGESIKQTASGFEYNTASYKTAIVPAMGFEFAKGRQRLLTLTVFYTKPLGQNEEEVTRLSGSKAVVTNLRPATSTWGLTVGVPFSFAKPDVIKTKRAKDHHRTNYRRCGRV